MMMRNRSKIVAEHRKFPTLVSTGGHCNGKKKGGIVLQFERFLIHLNIYNQCEMPLLILVKALIKKWEKGVPSDGRKFHLRWGCFGVLTTALIKSL